jgi:hypothetical protein
MKVSGGKMSKLSSTEVFPTLIYGEPAARYLDFELETPAKVSGRIAALGCPYFI